LLRHSQLLRGAQTRFSAMGEKAKAAAAAAAAEAAALGSAKCPAGGWVLWCSAVSC
jgi:hypothetical protein